MTFKEKMRSIDVLIVDDVQFIAGKESTQQEFMNCFNSLVEDNKQVVLVCDRCPLDLENIDEKLKSRISGGMIVNFKNTD
jgi:chromosomal replication initiator protein